MDIFIFIGVLIVLIFGALVVHILYQAKKIEELSNTCSQLESLLEQANKRSGESAEISDPYILQKFLHLQEAAHNLGNDWYNQCTENDLPAFVRVMSQRLNRSEVQDPTPQFLAWFMDALKNPLESNAHTILRVLRNDRALEEIGEAIRKWRVTIGVTDR